MAERKKRGKKSRKGSLSAASERMRKKGTVGKYTRHAGGKGRIGKSITKDLAPNSKASTETKREANFARMARRGWKPLPKSEKKSSKRGLRGAMHAHRTRKRHNSRTRKG